MIKVVIFDFDGVIENTYEKHYELSTKRTRDLSREEHKILFEGNILEGLEKIKHRNTDFDISKPFGDYISSLKTKNEVTHILKELSKHYILGIISSSWENIIVSYLSNNKLSKYLSFVYGKETHKSKIEKFNLVMKNFHISKEEVVFITDTLGDILEAKSVGIKSIAVDFGFHERTRLEKGKPWAIISHFDELPKLIAKL